MTKPITNAELADYDERASQPGAHAYSVPVSVYIALRERLRLAEFCIADLDYVAFERRGLIAAYRAATRGEVEGE